MYEEEIKKALAGQEVFMQLSLTDIKATRASLALEIIAQTAEPLAIYTQVGDRDDKTGLILKKF